jgi:poly-gamma-glutamate capsule biosynthesis protein CapA/YwtB (metallophosphatase superfamily)
MRALFYCRQILPALILLLSACAAVTVPVTTLVTGGQSAQPESQPTKPRREIRIAAVGDIMLGGSAEGVLQQQGYDYPFLPTRHLLEQADLAIGNLETALTNGGAPMVEKQFTFRNPPEKVAPALKRAGFDVVSLANNHSLDYGWDGLRDTLQVLQEHGIRAHGAGMTLAEARTPAIFTLADGQTAAFLAYSSTFPEEYWAGRTRPGTAFGHEQAVRTDVAKLVAQGIDIIVVSFHWGQELSKELRPYQPLLAHAAIDAGADLVLGHHPHILQAVEHYRDGLILYSLGNFAFGSRTTTAVTSVVAGIVFEDGRFRRLEMTPINVNNFQVEFQPRPLSDAAAASVYNELTAFSAAPLQYRDGLIIFEPTVTTAQTQTSDAQ